VPGRPFDLARLDATERAEVEAGAADTLAAITALVGGMGTATNGSTNFSNVTGVYGNAYAIRAAVTLAGLGANPPEDASTRC
jgi:hypothetical protein